MNPDLRQALSDPLESRDYETLFDRFGVLAAVSESRAALLALVRGFLERPAEDGPGAAAFRLIVCYGRLREAQRVDENGSPIAPAGSLLAELHETWATRDAATAGEEYVGAEYMGACGLARRPCENFLDLFRDWALVRDALTAGVGEWAGERTGVPDDARLSAAEIARLIGGNKEAVKKRLERWRHEHAEGWFEVPNPSPNAPRIVYRWGSVRDVVAYLRAP